MNRTILPWGRVLFFFLIPLLFFFLIGFPAVEAADAKPVVLVSIAPYKTFIEKIADDTVSVSTVVPIGANSHTYEPTPKQTSALMNADVWFRIGEQFEPKLAKLLEAHRPQMKMVNMRRGVKMIQFDTAEKQAHRCCYNDFEDIHIWLSPREVEVQAKTIEETLSALYPQHAELYRKRLEIFIEELKALDHEIIEIMAKSPVKVILVSHPAYAYFARDYGLKQLSVEFEGKDPTMQQLTKLLDQAREAHISKVFIQPQHSNKGAVLIAQQLNAKVVTLDPYAEDYFENMLKTAREFATSKKSE